MEKYSAEYIIVRYGELSTKGKNRKDFVARLIERIRQRLSGYPKLKIRYDYNRIYILLNGENEDNVAQDLQEVFGIATFSVAVKCNNAIETLCAAAIDLMKNETPSTYKVIARRQVKPILYCPPRSTKSWVKRSSTTPNIKSTCMIPRSKS
jgi:thiamine biosynthesis protein ThiI